MRKTVLLVPFLMVLFLLVWVGSTSLTLVGEKGETTRESRQSEPDVELTSKPDVELTLVGMLDGEPVFIDEVMIEKGVENTRRFYAANPAYGQFDEKALRDTLVEGQLLKAAKKRLMKEYGLLTSGEEERSMVDAAMREFSDNTGQCMSERLSHLVDGLKAMHISSASSELAFDTYCKPFGIEREEFKLYVDQMRQHPDPQNFLDSFPTTEEQIKQQTLASGGFTQVVLEKKLAEKLLNRSFEDSDFGSYLVDFKYEILVYLRDNLEVANPEYQHILEVIQQDIKWIRGDPDVGLSSFSSEQPTNEKDNALVSAP